MNQNQLFNNTRKQLAISYAGVMGIILSLSSLGVYEAIAHAHWVTLDRELESVAGTLHDSLEPTLKKPGKIDQQTLTILPDICLVENSCHTALENTPRHTVGVFHQGDYYVRLLDKSGKLVAIAGIVPQGLPQQLNPAKLLSNKKTIAEAHQHNTWETLTSSTGIRYSQISLNLHTQDYQEWGYMQVGKSFKQFDDYLTAVRWILGLGLPTAMILVAGASWWLAGLAWEPIYRSYKQMQQFTSDAAHELRTPLAATRATVESALREKQLSEDDAREILRTLERQNQRLSQLVGDLLLLSRIDQKNSEANPQLFSPQQVCLNDLVSDVCEELAYLALEAGVELTSEIPKQKLVQVAGVEEQLYRVFSNLVVNAIQNTRAGGKVTISLETNNNQALIKVQDTGTGIPTAEQSKIFQRFYRINTDRSRSSGGSGLGLPIAAAIVRSHSGSIQVSSIPGKGSTFTVELPLN